MRLTTLLNSHYNAAEWENKGYELPRFDIQAVRQKTFEEPTWIHFGGGNIFRAFPAALLNDALNSGKYDRGVIVAETFDDEVIDKAYTPYDNLSLLVSLKSTGTIEKKVIASVTEALKADPQLPDWKRLIDIFCNPTLQLVSFTITEKGYTLSSPNPYSITLILVVHCKLALVLSVGVLDKEHGMAFIFFYTIIRNLINY